MKNFLSSPKNVGVFHRYAPLLQGGWRKLLMLLGLIALCTFTMSKFLHVNMQGLNDLMGEERVNDISLVLGGIIGAFTITHFAAMLPIVVRDSIYLFKKRTEQVNKPVLAINLIICIGILGFDGYISTTGIKNAVADIGQDLAAQKYQVNSSGVEQSYSYESSQVWHSWRTDSANIERKYFSQISTLQSKAQGEITDLQSKAARGDAAGSTTWAASLRTAASKKHSNLTAKIGEIEGKKAQDLLDRSKVRDSDLSAKNVNKESRIGIYTQEKNRIEDRFSRYAGMTWVLSLGLYLLYIGTVVKQELIHIEAGIDNDVEVAERYFRPGFVQTLMHELGDWLHDIGRALTNSLAKKRASWKQSSKFRELVPLDGGDTYKQEAAFSPVVSMEYRNEAEGRGTIPEEEPYKRGTNIGFGDSFLPRNRTQPKSPNLPPPSSPNIAISAPVENKISNMSTDRNTPPLFSQISTSKSEISKSGVEISNRNPEISTLTTEISKNSLPFTLIGIHKVEAQMKFRAKVGAVKPTTYHKNMQNISKAKQLIQEKMGQTSLELWV